MTKTKRSKIRKWDEVGGAVETEIEESAALSEEEPGAGPSISRNPMRNIEDMIEQNDNSFDGVINNLPNPKPVAQMRAEDVIEEEQRKKSVLKKLQETVPDGKPVKNKPADLVTDCLERV